MRPFKFFFIVSVGLIVFFSLIRVLAAGFIAAAIMSLIYFVIQKFRRVVLNQDWENNYDRHVSFNEGYSIPQEESLFNEFDQYNRLRNRQYIEVL